VYARVVQGRTLYVNTTDVSKEIPIEGALSGLLSGKKWSGSLRLEPLGVELLGK
jgi:beta-galactosidase